MRSSTRALAAAWCLILSPAVAGAQDKGQAGVTMGHPGSVGLLWHVSDRVAVRPEFQFSYISSEGSAPELGLTSSSSGWNVAPGVSALFYLRRFDNLRTYVAPRFAFARSTTSSDSALTTGDARSTNKSYVGSASFGAQYSLGPRFGVFAEIGLAATRTTGSSSRSSIRTSGWQWTTRTGIGAVLYF